MSGRKHFVDPAIWAAVVQVVGLLVVAFFATNRYSTQREEHEKRFEAAEQMADLVNRGCAHAQELLEVSTVRVDAEGWNPDEMAAFEAQRRKVFDDYRDYTRDWRIGELTIGLFIQQYFIRPEVPPAHGSSRQWRELQQAVNDYLIFAKDAYIRGSFDHGRQEKLQNEVQARLEELFDSLLTEPLGD